MKAPPLRISPAPYVRAESSTNRMMYEVLIATVPPLMAATYLFGIVALLVVGTSIAGAALAEWFTRTEKRNTLVDGSAVLTGVLFGLTLPPSFPLWMAFLGGAIGMLLGKSIWGGLGKNVFNPALVGRAFVQAAFPTAITTWTVPDAGFFTIPPSTFAPPFFKAATDVVSTATPLGLAKFEHRFTEVNSLFFGNTAGSLGETSSLLLVVCALFLIARRTFDWRLTVSTVLSVAVFAGIMHAIKPDAYPSAAFMVFSGGLMFGAVFMCTDPVTTPVTKRGAWIFGIGVGVLVVLIRLFGGLPEAVMYSILFMNSLTPLINRVTQPRRFGG